MYILFICLFFGILSIVSLIPLFTLKDRLHGSDHYYHVLLIDLIRKNSHRFIKRVDNFLVDTPMVYPQLVHWMLSWFPKEKINFISQLFPSVLNVSSYLAFLFFSIKIYPFTQQVHSIPFEKFLFLVTIIYVSIPYTYNLVNAKNTGISARGLGLVLGQIYLYCLVLFFLEHSVLYLFIGSLVVFLILISSQFGTQFILLASPLLSLYYRHLAPLGMVILSVIIFLIIFPVIGIQYFKGQWGHKRNYFKYFAHFFILKIRYSIWRDWIYDFWKLLLRRDMPITRKLAYISNNSLFIAIFEIPILIILVVSFVLPRGGEKLLDIPFFSTLAGITIIPLTLFILTTFRISRFLGEPERYIEFSFGLLSIIFVLVFAGSLMTKIVLIYSFLFIGLKLIIYSSHKRSLTSSESMDHLRKKISELVEAGDDVRLLANDTEVARFLINSDIKAYCPSWISEREGRFHINEIMTENFPLLRKEILIELVRDYNINLIVIDHTVSQWFLDELKAGDYLTSQVLETDSHVVHKIWLKA